MLSLDEILALAPQDIQVQRKDRYRGGGAALRLEDFAEDEKAVITSLYEELQRLFQFLSPSGDDNPVRRKELSDLARELSLPAYQQQLIDLLNETEEERKATVFFDVAGGALSSLVGYILLIRVHGTESAYEQIMYYLVRDHLKIMRALIADLDPSGRARDEAPNYHSLDLLLEKWRDASYRAFERVIQVRFQNFYSGHVAERCLEFAEIDNLFYHLANNCVKFSVDGLMEIQVTALPEKKHLRWVFANRIHSSQHESLASIRESGRSIFEKEVSTMGKGYGLGILAESIGHAYGFDSIREAEEEGLIGTQVRDDTFILSFHWPMAREASL